MEGILQSFLLISSNQQTWAELDFPSLWRTQLANSLEEHLRALQVWGALCDISNPEHVCLKLFKALKYYDTCSMLQNYQWALGQQWTDLPCVEYFPISLADKYKSNQHWRGRRWRLGFCVAVKQCDCNYWCTTSFVWVDQRNPSHGEANQVFFWTTFLTRLKQ